MRPHDMKYIGFKHQRENKQNSDNLEYRNNPKVTEWHGNSEMNVYAWLNCHSCLISNELSSELLLFNANPAISSYSMARYHGENKLVFNEVMMKSALY